MRGAALRRGSAIDKAYAAEGRLNALGLYADANGVNRYVPADGNTYAGGISTFTVPTSNYTGTTILSAITGLTAPVAAAPYRVDAEIIISNGATTQAINLGTQGPAISDMRLQFYLFIDAQATQSVISTNSMNSINHFSTGSTLTGGSAYLCQVRGYINFSAASGTLFGFQTSAANAFTIVGDSYMDLRPV